MTALCVTVCAMTTDTDCSDLPILRVGGLTDMAQAIPYLLGFHPERSLVVVGLAARRVVVTARMDLDDLTDPRLLPSTVSAMVRGGARSFLGAVFDDCAAPPDSGDLPWCGVAAELTVAVERLGAAMGTHRAPCDDPDPDRWPRAEDRESALEFGADEAEDDADDADGDIALDDVVLVSGGRLWSYTCRDARCCPPQGRPIEGTSTVAAEAAFAGMVALPDRGSLAAQLEPRAPAERDRLRPALDAAEADGMALTLAGAVASADRSAIRALFAAARALDDPQTALELPEEQVCRLGAALRRIDVRDSLWLGIDDRRIDGRRLWRQLAARLPAPFDAAPLFLFGWASYRAGDGALAGMAADRALDSDPAYSAADLLMAAVGQAINPHQLPRLRSTRSARSGPWLRAGRREARPDAAGRMRR